MLSKKALAGIAIIAVLAVVVIAASMGSSGPDARYNYDIELTDTFVNEGGSSRGPSTGCSGRSSATRSPTKAILPM